MAISDGVIFLKSIIFDLFAAQVALVNKSGFFGLFREFQQFCGALDDLRLYSETFNQQRGQMRADALYHPEQKRSSPLSVAGVTAFHSFT